MGPCIIQEENDPEYIAAFDLQSRASCGDVCLGYRENKRK